jgi:serine/threonine protein kinase
MPASLDCPGIECWQLLFNESATPEEWEFYEQHLESCPACQERLDQAQDVADILRQQARRLGDPTRATADPTLARVVTFLCEQYGSERMGPVEPADLSFLRPSDQPGVLGTLGGYEIREVIGQGGMGVVLKAYEPALHRLVAIKVLSPTLAAGATARRRFTREARAAAAVCQEHIVPVYRVQEADGLPYLVMQYIAGESLQDRLDRAGPLQLVEIIRIGLQTASGLAAAHAQGLIHRDIKPANILLSVVSSSLSVAETAEQRTTDNGQRTIVKITDFGLARMVDDVGLTQNGVVAGTPEYMAPEQARGDPVDHRADLFSLGSVLYALCTGIPPFRAAAPLAVLRKVIDQVPLPIRALRPDIPAWLEGLVARLLAKNPADRFTSATEVVHLLEGYLAHLDQPATVAVPNLPASLPPGSQRTSQTARWWRPFTQLFSLPAGLFVAFVVAALALGILYWLAGVGGPEPTEDARELHLPLRGIPEERVGWKLIGPGAEKCVKFEPEGLRITLTAGLSKEGPNTGLRIPMPARGDFEVTIHYEILTEPEPANAGLHPTKLMLLVQLDRQDRTVAAFARRVALDKGTQFTTWTMRDNHDNNGNRQTRARQHPAQAKVGRLRILRIGSEASFYAAEGPNADFTLLPPPRHFGEEDLRSIELVGSTGGPNATLDVRLTDLRVRMSTRLAPPPSEGNAHLSARIALPIVAVVLTALGLGVWLLLRSRRDPAEQQATDSAAKPDHPAAAMPLIAFNCSGCARGLKARAEIAGKKIKCPHCGTAVRVPLAGSAGAGLHVAAPSLVRKPAQADPKRR